MANIGDLIGVFMQSAMAPSGGNRIGKALEELMRSGLGGAGAAPQGGMPGGMGMPGGGNPGAMLGGILDMVKSGLGGAGGALGGAGGAPGGGAGMLESLAGALFGGGGRAPSGSGMAGGAGILAVLAGIAMKALQSGGQAASAQTGGGPGMNFGSAGPWSGGEVPVAMRGPRNTAEQEAFESTAQLVLKGMINAAKSDGQVSPEEMQRIVGKLGATGADQNAQQWVMQQLSAPLNVRAFAAEVPNQEVAAQVYAASLLAIEVDTPAEKQYLKELAEAMGLHPLVVGQIHQSLGVTG